jgi:hypothetical protein
MGEHWRVTPQKVHAPVAGLLRWRRWRLSVDLLQSLNSVVQSGHHLHLELEELLRRQRWRHRIGIGWPILWLFCPCWPELVLMLLVFTICLQQNEIYKRQILYDSGKKTLVG